MTYKVQFYANDNGKEPAKDFIDGLSDDKRAVLLAAIETVLVRQGKDVCASEYGKNLKEGLYEFRVRDGSVALRLYFHAHGDKLILLLAGYDKGRFGEGRRQQKSIKQARRYLTDYKLNPPT